ncbi:DUF1330 domain-containing protein [Limnohabitans sp. Rim8]|uniref:DUF1330 domain-containing protein n=1 Tax=Limnohabitans sp. Rim8 TaxID=1100718 RepID=UPI00261A9BC1|nr:DUF1330 domain-containing protein [Limnohabitans sp. Rim8]
MTKAYIVGEITVHNPEAYALYGQKVPATIAQYGGKYLVRGGTSTQLEGKAQGTRRVVIEFASRAAAETWYHSPEYQAILPLRQNNSEGHLVLFDGYDG